ncbi:hypothetical protein DFH06DRAFT_1128127 [Mycena polygramma]|nr:hypothetical protein DFH06DRAFT_1128127 [Mycena polygramma]
MATPLSNDLAARLGFVNARYHEDYDAVRVRSIEGGSHFLFLHTNLSTLQLSDAIQCRRQPKIVILLGEVDWEGDSAVKKVPCSLDGQARKVVAIRLKKPMRATCEVGDVYGEQQMRLKDIILDDEREFGGETVQSWFDASVIEEKWWSAEEQISAHGKQVFVRDTVAHRTKAALALEAGNLISVTGSMERVDIDAAGGIQRRYYIWVTMFKILEETFS